METEGSERVSFSMIALEDKDSVEHDCRQFAHGTLFISVVPSRFIFSVGEFKDDDYKDDDIQVLHTQADISVVSDSRKLTITVIVRHDVLFHECSLCDSRSAIHYILDKLLKNSCLTDNIVIGFHKYLRENYDMINSKVLRLMVRIDPDRLGDSHSHSDSSDSDNDDDSDKDQPGDSHSHSDSKDSDSSDSDNDDDSDPDRPGDSHSDGDNSDSEYTTDDDDYVYDLVPTTRSPIDALKKVKVENIQQCTICLEELLIDSQTTQMPCLHLYHQNCIDNWLQINGLCPLCRCMII